MLEDETMSPPSGVDPSNGDAAGEPVSDKADTPPVSEGPPARDRNDQARAPLPLIGISINSVSRPGGPSRRANPA